MPNLLLLCKKILIFWDFVFRLDSNSTQTGLRLDSGSSVQRLETRLDLRVCDLHAVLFYLYCDVWASPSLLCHHVASSPTDLFIEIRSELYLSTRSISSGELSLIPQFLTASLRCITIIGTQDYQDGTTKKGLQHWNGDASNCRGTFSQITLDMWLQLST